MAESRESYDVLIIGGGIVGTALLYVLSRYTNIPKIALVEKHKEFAMVNSHCNNNSQTLHFGDIETNYSVEKARKVKEAAELVLAYLKKYGEGMFVKGYKMVLGVGHEEIRELEVRYEEFKSLFPKLKKLSREGIAAIEPNLVNGRNPNEELLALYTEDGYAVNFKKLAESFIQKALEADKTIDIFMNTEVKSIKREEDGYILDTDKNTLKADAVVVAAGPHSLVFAKSLGYGKELGILPVAGNFYCAKNVLRGKVYMMQIKKMPFAAVHGDPDVNNPDETRFGPTIRVLPLLERHNYRTLIAFLKTSAWNIDGVLSLLKLMGDKDILKYIIKNILYDLPLVGKWFFLRIEVRKIVPSLTAREIKLGRGIGGIRPQVVNIKTKNLEMGEAEIVGDKIIFNITPSPGASVCLKNAENEAQKVVDFLGHKFRFDRKSLLRDLSLSQA